VVILDTGTRRGLVDSAYTERRSQCDAAAEFFQVKALRDVTPEIYEQRAGQLPEITCRRARHVITENLRVERAVDAMQRGDAAALGELMNESHASLQEDYEVSSDALNAMVDAARKHPACFGARMTGAGFGGCAVAIIKAEASDDFASRVAADYQQATGHSPAVYVTGATPGAEAVRM
ncbi:MAG: galactokinase, partial [Thermoguttaceae bacterium]|nr:galactokinase [Thermoguttaceae bacterium]